WKAVSLEMMALLYEISGQVEKAATLYINVIALREKIGGDGLETTYNNLGILFKGQGNHQKALFYFRKSYKLELQNKNNEGIAGSMVNMSISLKNLGYPDSSFTFLKKALTIAKPNSLYYITSNVYLGLSDYYTQKNKLDSALYYCWEIINSNNLKAETVSFASALQNVGAIYIKKGEYQLALVHLNKAEIELEKLNNLEYNNQLYALKAEAFEALGKYKQAYNYLTKFVASKDSLISKESVTILHNLEQKYETEKKERQIIELQLEATNSENQQIIFIFTICLVVLGIIFLFILLKSKSKANAIISISLSEKETLLKEIHHRVKNNLQIISSLLNLQSRYISDKAAKQAVNEGKSRVKAMALIHQKLYQKGNLTGIEMEDYIRNLVESLFVSYGINHKQITFISDISNIRLDVDTAIPLGLILNELVTNVLKYAFEGSKGELFIQLIKENNNLKLTVKDNGKGFKKSDAAQEGYGMRLIESLSRKLKATVLADSSAGTTYILTIEKFKLV
ncbi:Two-component system sensor histidine kinase, partial [hydrothermal vent metagenome]